jgi:pyruvate formate lyase activating enzyme
MLVTLTRAVEVVNQYRHGLRTMKGGLTISGGEPLMQHHFVLKLFAGVQKLSVHTALDTNGYLGDRLSDEDLAKIDLVTQRKGAWNRQAAVADFGPAPQLDAFWADARKPFRAVPRKDFGFKIIVRVVEEAQAEIGPTK